MIKRIIFASLALLLLIAGFLAFRLFRPAVKLPGKENSFFYIETGDDRAAVKRHLVEQHFIKGSGWNLACQLFRYRNVRPGRYKLTAGMNLFNLVKMLRNGSQSEVKMVIIKERTKELFAGKTGKGKKYDLECDSLQMIRFLGNNDSLRKFGVDSNTVLGIMMPYTYQMKWNTTPGKIVQQFYNAYNNFWTPERKIKADSLHLSPMEVSTLASIIEEETNRKEDKYQIASTYLNRLQAGMKLQADPTVRFALKDFGIKRITGAHLQVVSAYNTYLNTGLPPGPICTPSIESLDAVLDAPRTDYLFFVASYRFDGSSIFTSNINDHMKFARLYQQELTRRMDSAKKTNTGK